MDWETDGSREILKPFLSVSAKPERGDHRPVNWTNIFCPDTWTFVMRQSAACMDERAGNPSDLTRSVDGNGSAETALAPRKSARSKKAKSNRFMGHVERTLTPQMPAALGLGVDVILNDHEILISQRNAVHAGRPKIEPAPFVITAISFAAAS